MDAITLFGKKFVPYITAKEIEVQIARLANEIRKDVADRDCLFVCIMNGAFMFASELMKQIDIPAEVGFARYSSYQGLHSSASLKEIMPLGIPVKGRTVIIIEDLIDTGYTMACLKKKYLDEGAKEVRIAAMLIKPEALTNVVTCDYVGLEIENKFIVGHGLDFDGRGRMLKDIYQIEE
jgi:hypothetical protein